MQNIAFKAKVSSLYEQVVCGLTCRWLSVGHWDRPVGCGALCLASHCSVPRFSLSADDGFLKAGS